MIASMPEESRDSPDPQSDEDGYPWDCDRDYPLDPAEDEDEE